MVLIYGDGLKLCKNAKFKGSGGKKKRERLQEISVEWGTYLKRFTRCSQQQLETK